MFGAERTRTLLGPVDPARDTAVAPPLVSARDLIDRAGTAGLAAGRRRVRPTRRLVLTAGTLAVAAGAVAVFQPIDGVNPETGDLHEAAQGSVLVPVAYQFGSDAPAAGPHLRALAGKLVDAEYDNRGGRYMYHHTKLWGDPVMTSDDGRFHVAFADETRTWRAADGTGNQTSVQLEPQYPDQESRDYWRRNLRKGPVVGGTPAPATIPLPPVELTPPRADRSQLRELLKTGYGAGAVSKEVSRIYGDFVVPRRTRGEILRVLADVPGFRWRGQVTDRVGRKGVAVTFDDREHDAQSLLIFDPQTGGLLAHEQLTLAPVRMSSYQVILDTAWTDRLG
ncbi:CU044_5270 family protein [Micromonospora sp. STR1_7]|uniref:CU044_5270 family protein n=1 Tax=Micromonospora parastrephiae TaxID=2806101 RepID=A0ABS1XSG0_9ACTN|nr:CU044_5270 family protein [Micromonospora parastrephiae]MBM0232193.1 CU044_5270 family protein [Micromonospora parastrephiae]